MEDIFAGGYFKSESIIIGYKTLINAYHQGTVYFDDGMIIKYNQEGEVEWATSVGGDNDDEITCIEETSDGGYICRRIFYK